MEGLIPFLFHAIKGHNRHKHYRSLSDGSSRGYHLLAGTGDSSYEGSSHRRTLSEFQPPTVEFLEQRSGLELLHSRSFRRNTANVLSPSKMNEYYSKQMGTGGSSAYAQKSLNQGNFSNLRRRS